MKLSHLLAGAALAALTAGAASAQQYVIVNTDLNASSTGGAVTFQSTAGGDTYQLASELNLVNAARTTDIMFEIVDQTSAGGPDATDGASAWGTGSATFRVELEGFLLNASVLAAAFDCTGVAGTGITVVDGGTAGDDFVEIEIADITLCVDGAGDGILQVDDLPVIFQGPSGNFSTSLTRTSTGAAIEGGTAEYEGSSTSGGGNNPLVLLSPSVSVRNTAGQRNTVTAELPDYEALDSNDIGEISVTVSNGTAAAALDFQNTGVAGNVDVDITVTVPELAGLDLDLAELDGNTGDVTGNSIEYTGVAAGDLQFDLFEDAADPAAIRPQTITASADIDFDATLLGDKTAAVTVGSIDREGVSAGPFEWTGGENAISRSVFRMTGFDPDEPIPAISIILGNTQKDIAETEFTLDTSGLNLSSGGELVLTSDTIGAQGGDYGRADVTFFFEGDGILVRRLIASADGTLTTFDGDFDQECGSATITFDGDTDASDSLNEDETLSRAGFTCTQ